jgi:hypothetical protein
LTAGPLQGLPARLECAVHLVDKCISYVLLFVMNAAALSLTEHKPCFCKLKWLYRSGGLEIMAYTQTLTRLVDRYSIEIVVDALVREGFSRNDIVQAIVCDVPTDLDILNEVLDAFEIGGGRDGSTLIH